MFQITWPFTMQKPDKFYASLCDSAFYLEARVGKWMAGPFGPKSIELSQKIGSDRKSISAKKSRSNQAQNCIFSTNYSGRIRLAQSNRALACYGRARPDPKFNQTYFYWAQISPKSDWTETTLPPLIHLWGVINNTKINDKNILICHYT